MNSLDNSYIRILTSIKVKICLVNCATTGCTIDKDSFISIFSKTKKLVELVERVNKMSTQAKSNIIKIPHLSTGTFLRSQFATSKKQ